MTQSWARVFVVALASTGCDGAEAEEQGEDNGDPCDACGDTPCKPPAEDDLDCLGADAICVPPAEDPCASCMQGACASWVGRDCEGFDCIDYAAAIGGCGDAVPYAEAYECMATNCAAECAPGAAFDGCKCV